MALAAGRPVVDRRHRSGGRGRGPGAAAARSCSRIEPPGERDLGRLALVAGAALAFATVAIPLQLKQQWITIGWALEGAALAWLYRRIPHRGLLYSATALLVGRVRPAGAQPEIFVYEPRGMRVFNWYLYTYLICARRDVRWRPGGCRRPTIGCARRRCGRASRCCQPPACILLFLLLNIEIADFYCDGPEITFRFGVTLAQDLTYTIGWLVFGLGCWRRASTCTSRAGPRRGRRADRGHDVQGVSLRHGIARRPLSRRCRSSAWPSRCRSWRWRCRSSCCRRRRKPDVDPYTEVSRS